ncbi:hypothetical protein AB0H86_30950 [Streptomyces sp. NPDC050997]|uniref:hypothetical protein n=1 Tax=Streptomyces sp. NPDC050997 TaxID=3155519 RepID=UPI00342EF921
MNTQLNRQESRHYLARKIFHGQKGRAQAVVPRGTKRPVRPCATSRDTPSSLPHSSAGTGLELGPSASNP